MSYITALPKELQDLLNHYINYDYWCCLSDIYKSIFYVAAFSSTKSITRIMNDMDSKLKEVLRLCEFEYNLIEAHDRMNYGIWLIELKINQLVTKQKLLDCINIIINNPINYMEDTVKDIGKINKCLEIHNFSQRIIIYYNDLESYHDIYNSSSTDFSFKISNL